MSICLYTVLFSLGDPAANGYVRMFLKWLSFVIRKAGLQAEDRLVIVADEETVKLLKGDMHLDAIGSSLKCRCDIMQMPKPKTVREGMMWKYIPFEYSQDILLYLDVDVLVMNKLSGFEKGKLYLHAEGDWSHPLYGSGGIGPGFSAGKWACGSREIRDKLIQAVWKAERADKTEHYTVEQPFFNKAVRELGPFWNAHLLISPRVSSNGTNFSKEKTMLLDLCGTPGDAGFHENKMATMFAYLWVRGDLD